MGVFKKTARWFYEGVVCRHMEDRFNVALAMLICFIALLQGMFLLAIIAYSIPGFYRWWFFWVLALALYGAVFIMGEQADRYKELKETSEMDETD